MSRGDLTHTVMSLASSIANLPCFNHEVVACFVLHLPDQCMLISVRCICSIEKIVIFPSQSTGRCVCVCVFSPFLCWASKNKHCLLIYWTLFTRQLCVVKSSYLPKPWLLEKYPAVGFNSGYKAFTAFYDKNETKIIMSNLFSTFNAIHWNEKQRGGVKEEKCLKAIMMHRTSMKWF